MTELADGWRHAFRRRRSLVWAEPPLRWL